MHIESGWADWSVAITIQGPLARVASKIGCDRIHPPGVPSCGQQEALRARGVHDDVAAPRENGGERISAIRKLSQALGNALFFPQVRLQLFSTVTLDERGCNAMGYAGAGSFDQWR